MRSRCPWQGLEHDRLCLVDRIDRILEAPELDVNSRQLKQIARHGRVLVAKHPAPHGQAFGLNLQRSLVIPSRHPD